MSCVWVQDQRPLRSGKSSGHLVVRNRGTNGCCCDLLDLVAIDKSQTVVVRFHGDTVEKIELRDLEDVLHRAELCARRGRARSSNFECFACTRMGRP